jgi:hypothetical protein
MLRFLTGLSDFLRSRLNKWNSCIQYAICTFSPIVIHIMHLKLYLRHHFKHLTGTSSATSCTILNSFMHQYKYYKATSHATLNHILNYRLHHIETQPASSWTKSSITILHYILHNILDLLESHHACTIPWITSGTTLQILRPEVFRYLEGQWWA